MHRSDDFIDEPSRLKQFAWEQWENQIIAVIFRPGPSGNDRFILKRYLEQTLAQSERWKQLAPYFSSISPLIRAYSVTAYEIELMRRILDYHLSDKLHLRITQANDQIIEYDALLDFIRRAEELYVSKSNSYNNAHSMNGKKPSIPLIPSVHSSYVSLAPPKPTIYPLPQSITSKTNPVKPVSVEPSPPPPIAGVSTSQVNKYQATVTNGHRPSQPLIDSSARLGTNTQIKSNLTSSAAINSIRSTSNQSTPSILPELCPIALYNAKIDGSGWVQINNVYLPFIIKHRQRLVPYQVLVSCKILENDELRATLSRATLADVTLMNRMIRDCKINNEEIVENTPLINMYHVLIGTKNLVYIKVLPKDNPTSKINRHYKSILALNGGSLRITYRQLPYVCSSNHSYISLNDVLSIYPNLYTQLKLLARVPRTNELDYLQLVQMYYDEKELPSDTSLIAIEDLNQVQISPSRQMPLIEYHAKEKSKLEEQIAVLNKSITNKRKNQESHNNRQNQQRLKLSTSSNRLAQSATAFIRPPTGYFPGAAVASSYNQQHHWLSTNNGQRGRTRLQ